MLCSNSGGGGGGAGGPGLPATYNARTWTYTAPDGTQQTVSAPAGPSSPTDTSCTNPYRDSQYFRTTLASPTTPVRVVGYATGPSGTGGPGLVVDITGQPIEYARGGDGGNTTFAPPTPGTGSGGNGAYGLFGDSLASELVTRRASEGASGTVIIRYQIP